MQAEASRDEQIVGTIRALLAQNYGATAEKAIDFYADAHIALSNPAEYARMLRNIFGAGTGHLLTAIIGGLGKKFGVGVSEGTTLDELIASLRPKPAGRPPA